MDAKLAFVEYRLFRKTRANGRTGGDAATIVKETIQIVPHPLPYISVNDFVACDSSSLESYLTFVCVYHPTGWNPQIGTPLNALLTSLFDSPLRFVIAGDLNAGHVN